MDKKKSFNYQSPVIGIMEVRLEQVIAASVETGFNENGFQEEEWTEDDIDTGDIIFT